MATIYKATGERESVSPNNGTDFQLEELQNIVGGYIEIIRFEDNIMVLNEEGKLMRLPYNQYATDLFRKYYNTNDFIVGDVLICKSEEVK